MVYLALIVVKTEKGQQLLVIRLPLEHIWAMTLPHA